jgi:hypothetical protein
MEAAVTTSTVESQIVRMLPFYHARAAGVVRGDLRTCALAHLQNALELPIIQADAT